MLHVALRRNDSALLALADTWSRRAMREIGSDDAFYSREIEITPRDGWKIFALSLAKRCICRGDAWRRLRPTPCRRRKLLQVSLELSANLPPDWI